MVRDIRAKQKTIDLKNQPFFKACVLIRGSNVFDQNVNKFFYVPSRCSVRFVLAILVTPISPRIQNDFEKLKQRVEENAFELVICGIEHGGKAPDKKLDGDVT